MTNPQRHTIAIVGGTGPEGLGLAVRFAMAGHKVIVGSRRIERAQEAAQKVLEKAPGQRVEGLENEPAVRQSDIVVITVPFAGQKETLEGLRDAIGEKVVVDTVVPLEFIKGRPKALLVPEGSATEQAQAVLPKARVVGAFHNLSAKELMDTAHGVPSDVVVCGNDAQAKGLVMDLARQIKGARAVDAGGIEVARYIEDITALLLNINRIYKTQSMIKIVGV